MLVQFPLILSFLAFVAAFIDHEGTVCNKVCIKTSKCIKKFDDDNHLICEDITGFAQLKCTTECTRRPSSAIWADNFNKDIFTESDEPFIPTKTLWNTKYSFMDMLGWPIKNVASNMNDYSLTGLLFDLAKDAYQERRIKRQIPIYGSSSSHATAGVGGGGANAAGSANVAGGGGRATAAGSANVAGGGGTATAGGAATVGDGWGGAHATASAQQRPYNYQAYG